MKAEDELAEKILEQLGYTDKIEGAMEPYLKWVREIYNKLDRCITEHGDDLRAATRDNLFELRREAQILAAKIEGQKQRFKDDAMKIAKIEARIRLRKEQRSLDHAQTDSRED